MKTMIVALVPMYTLYFLYGRAAKFLYDASRYCMCLRATIFLCIGPIYASSGVNAKKKNHNPISGVSHHRPLRGWGLPMSQRQAHNIGHTKGSFFKRFVMFTFAGQNLHSPTFALSRSLKLCFIADMVSLFPRLSLTVCLPHSSLLTLHVSHPYLSCNL